jgi:nitroimidazol reductase NimA-like FMN-containing flavoprotein (pyridoxamine 5'-phosphate oxidase superfamily)
MMKRSEMERTDPAWIAEVFRDATVCRVAFAGPEPYLVPLCFGFEENRIYLHSAPGGKKMDRFAKTPGLRRVRGGGGTGTVGPALLLGVSYRSVIASGTVYIVEDEEEKLRALPLIAGHYGAEGTIAPDSAGQVAGIRIDLDEISGKTAGYP